jgi:hypothetical protein
MSGTLICGKTTGNAVVPLQVNADGTLEMTAEIDSSALAKESTLDSFRTENATNLGALALALDDGTQVARCMGSEDPNDPAGTQKQLHVDGSGNVQTNVVNTVNINPANTVNSGITNDPANSVAVGLRARTDIADAATETFLKCDASGNLQVDVNNTANVKFEDISSSLNSGTANDPANSLAVGLRARQTITDSTTETFLKCDASGVLEVSSSGGGSSSSTQTSESKSVPDSALTVIGDNVNAYIDTNGGNKFVIIVQSTSGAGGAQISIEWSDVTGFTAGNVSVVNGFVAGSADATPASLSAVTRADSSTLTNQRVFSYETIPARYCRITVIQTSGGALTYVGKSYLSP